MALLALATGAAGADRTHPQEVDIEALLEGIEPPNSSPSDRPKTGPGHCAEHGGDCDGCCDECQECCDDCGCVGNCTTATFFYGGALLGAVDGWKGRIDDENNNNFGGRIGGNFGVTFMEDFGLQLGGSYGGYDFHGRGERQRQAGEQQVFITGGAFKRFRRCLDSLWDRFCFGAVYDLMIADNLGEQADGLTIGQIRGRAGLAFNECTEFGVFGSIGIENETLTFAERRVRSLDQIAIYWRRVWDYGADTMLYFGFAEDPGEVLFGLAGECPLNDGIALFGNFHYILPSTQGGDFPLNSYTEEFWNVSVGLTFYWGTRAPRAHIAGDRWMPLIPLADNGSFALEVPAGNFGP
jgi:hypothetical protein